MAAVAYDLTIEQGATFALVVAVLNEDGTVKPLTGYNAAMQIRADPASVPLVTYALNSQLFINALAGKVMVEVLAEETATYGWTRGLYDLEITSPAGVVSRLAQGRVRVSKEITRT